MSQTYASKYKELLKERNLHNNKINETQKLIEKAERKHKRLIGKKGMVQALDKLMELEELHTNLIKNTISLTDIHKEAKKYDKTITN
tara:strand:+ start:446 stop:706 length:261 start_codon:yes stop_codon:yes gene_type:complete